MNRPDNDDFDEDPVRHHAQEPAEGDVDPGEVSAGSPHAEEAAEGDADGE